MATRSATTRVEAKTARAQRASKRGAAALALPIRPGECVRARARRNTPGAATIVRAVYLPGPRSLHRLLLLDHILRDLPTKGQMSATMHSTHHHLGDDASLCARELLPC